MTRSLSVLAVAGASLLLAATASPQTGTTLTIRHQLRGCHSWSVNGGAYKPSQSVTLTKGATLTSSNNDVMPHKLVKLSGPALTLASSANMNHAGRDDARQVLEGRRLQVHDESRRGLHEGHQDDRRGQRPQAEGDRALAVVTDGLDVVAVRVEDERAVVTGVVDGPLTGRPVAFEAGGDGDAMELVDGLVVRRRRTRDAGSRSAGGRRARARTSARRRRRGSAPAARARCARRRPARSSRRSASSRRDRRRRSTCGRCSCRRDAAPPCGSPRRCCRPGRAGSRRSTSPSTAAARPARRRSCSRRRRPAPERVDVRARARDERDVQVPRDRLLVASPARCRSRSTRRSARPDA